MTRVLMISFVALAFLSACGSLPLSGSSEIDGETITLSELRAEYRLPDSEYIDIDGVNIHYTDQGQGDPIVLLHASFLNLHSWNGIAERLKENYRVIRFDFPNAGLSGSETRPAPNGKYNLIERNVEILSKLIDALGLAKVSLIATSSGGSVGFRYASYSPDSVERLVLINSAGMPRSKQTDPNRDRPDFQKWSKAKVRPLEFWEYGFSKNFIQPNEAPDWLVEQAYDFARREGLAEINAQYVFTTGDPEAIVKEISAPTLILWGLDNPTVMHLEADVFSYWMTNAPTIIKKYPGLGHYPYVENEAVVFEDLSKFFAGAFDSSLRRTDRVKP